MAKPSGFMRQMEAQVKRLCDLQRRFTIQQMEDMAVIALGEWYEAHFAGADLTPGQAAAFRDMLRAVLMDYAEVAIADDARSGNNDPQLNYTKGKVDAALLRLLGDAFVPWEERYEL